MRKLLLPIAAAALFGLSMPAFAHGPGAHGPGTYGPGKPGAPIARHHGKPTDYSAHRRWHRDWRRHHRCTTFWRHHRRITVCR